MRAVIKPDNRVPVTDDERGVVAVFDSCVGVQSSVLVLAVDGDVLLVAMPFGVGSDDAVGILAFCFASTITPTIAQPTPSGRPSMVDAMAAMAGPMVAGGCDGRN